jgi:hypothetical protein
MRPFPHAWFPGVYLSNNQLTCPSPESKGDDEELQLVGEQRKEMEGCWFAL